MSQDRVSLEAVRSIVDDEVIPLERRFLTEGFQSVVGALDAVRERAKREGLFAPFLPPEYGGRGLSLVEYARVSEELGRSPLGHYAFNCQAPDVGNMELLLKYGTEEQRSRYLEPLCAGAIRSCFSMTEPEHAGSNPIHMSTVATREGSGYRIEGHKWFTTAADGASFAIVMAVTDPEAESPYRRATQIIVPCDTPGFERVENISVMGQRGALHQSHAEIRYQGCRVPLSNRLGDEGAGFAMAQERLGPGRIHHCMRWIGICERAFELLCARAVSRELAPGRALGTRQVVQLWIAESRAEIDAARLLVLDCARRIDEEGSYQARDSISLIKFFTAGVMQRVLDRAIQAHGALGVTDYTPLAFWWSHERAARIYDGPDEVHKVSVAKRILRRYGLALGRD
ncbi:MAG: acyl-CoA dehydrogenase family protein [Myxococcales bacterium]|nr:acyl-CoA dehydrogenase family protein [Myxococcales bacterium]